MTIQTGITTNRKALAAQISEQLPDAPMTYAGVPSCAYNVGSAVSIDRQGSIEVTDESTLTFLKPFFIAQGWMDAEPIDEPTDEVEVPAISGDEIPVTDEPSSESESKPVPAPDADTVHTFGMKSFSTSGSSQNCAVAARMSLSRYASPICKAAAFLVMCFPFRYNRFFIVCSSLRLCRC